MKARLILSAVVVASLSGCASLAEDIVDGVAEAAVGAVFAIALSPFDDDDKRQNNHHKHQRDRASASAAWSTPAIPVSYAATPTTAPMKTREKEAQQ